MFVQMVLKTTEQSSSAMVILDAVLQMEELPDDDERSGRPSTSRSETLIGQF
jgi:hypothetical protein